MGGRGAMTDKERETMRMGLMGMRMMATGGATEGQNGNGDNKMARKTTKKRAGGRGCT